MHLGAVRFRTCPAGSGTRWTPTSLDLLDLVKPRVIPVHYEGWSHFQQGRDAAEPVLSASRFADRVHWVDPGEGVTLPVSTRSGFPGREIERNL